MFIHEVKIYRITLGTQLVIHNDYTTSYTPHNIILNFKEDYISSVHLTPLNVDLFLSRYNVEFTTTLRILGCNNQIASDFLKQLFPYFTSLTHVILDKCINKNRVSEFAQTIPKTIQFITFVGSRVPYIGLQHFPNLKCVETDLSFNLETDLIYAPSLTVKIKNYNLFKNDKIFYELRKIVNVKGVIFEFDLEALQYFLDKLYLQDPYPFEVSLPFMNLKEAHLILDGEEEIIRSGDESLETISLLLYRVLYIKNFKINLRNNNNIFNSLMNRTIIKNPNVHPKINSTLSIFL